MVIIFVFSTSNYTLWNKKKLKIEWDSNRKDPVHKLMQDFKFFMQKASITIFAKLFLLGSELTKITLQAY